MLLKRQEIDWMLALLLLCFTCGLGTLVYVLIYLSKPEDRCVHCNTIVEPQIPEFQSQPSQMSEAHTSPVQTSINNRQTHQTQHTESQSSKKEMFCPYCGEKIASNARFCPGCGAKTV